MKTRYSHRVRAIVTTVALTTAASLAVAEPLSVRADHASGIYQPGEAMHVTVHADDPTVHEVTYRLLRDGKTPVAQGELNPSPDASIERPVGGPGTLLIVVEAIDRDGKPIRVTTGVAVAPEQIRPAASSPTDFDAFWAEKLAELNAVPANPQLTKLPPSTMPSTSPAGTGVDYWHVTLDNVRGTHIRGQLARPRQGDRFPALLILQWAGVYPLDRAWVVDRARDGWLAFNINAHDLAIDESGQFYADQFAGPLKDYWTIGNDDRENSYFLRMYLSCYRAAEYLASRPDWDGRTLVVMGGSQGGQQSLVTAALEPKITAALADVPAGCDFLAADRGGVGGWPHWIESATGRDPARVREACRYFDVANFAPRIRCPVLIGVGLKDETCPPRGVFAMASQITSPKEIVPMPLAGHQDEHDSHAPYARRCWTAWLPALLRGDHVPPPEPSSQPMR